VNTYPPEVTEHRDYGRNTGFHGRIEWESTNGRWIITRRFSDITNPSIDVWRKDIRDCPVTPFDVYMPKYVDRAWSKIYFSTPELYR
jgi:hypothetical protein